MRSRKRRPEEDWALGLPSFELRCALLEVRRDPLARVVALEQELLQLALDREAVVEAHLRARLHGPLDAADSLAGFVRRRELPRVLLNRVGEALPLERRRIPDVGDETDRLRLVERHQPAGH